MSTMMTNGVLVNYDCSKSSAWVNRAVWEKYNAEQKRNMTIGLATACDTQHAGYRISIIDYDSRVATVEIAADEVAAGIEACGFDRGPVHFVTDSVSSPGIDGSTRWAHSGCLALTMGR